MNNRYIKVEWPDSQKWLGHLDCFLATSNLESERGFEPIVFVPETIYNLSK